MCFCVYDPLRQFRLSVYQTFYPSRDAAFEIIDAIANSPYARSAVEVTLSPTMERSFSSLYKALERTRIDLDLLRPLLVKQAEECGSLLFDRYAIYALDHTPYPRKSAPTVSDRSYVHGADGVVVGHQYSILGRVMHEEGSWIGVVDIERIPTTKTPSEVGAQQIERLKENSSLPVIITADSEYVTDEILDSADEKTHLLIRFRSNRNLFDAPAPKPESQPGPQSKHGEKMKLNREETLREPDEVVRVEEEDGSFSIISVFKGVHVKSRPQVGLCAIRVEVYNPEGKKRYNRAMWLAWTGPEDMDWSVFWRVYLKRFVIECVHQFTKNNLSWTRARLGYTGREERWTWMVMLAYWQLLMAAPLARDVSRPWEKPKARKCPPPARVQRDYQRIIIQVGSPVLSPKVRGKGRGRPEGYHPMARPSYRVVYKGEKEAVGV